MKKMQLDDMELTQAAGGTITPVKPISPVIFPSKPFPVGPAKPFIFEDFKKTHSTEPICILLPAEPVICSKC